MKTIITLQQAQLAYDSGMDQLAYYLLTLAYKQMQQDSTEKPEEFVAAWLTKDCAMFLCEYAETLSNDRVEYADYCAVASIFNPL